MRRMFFLVVLLTLLSVNSYAQQDVDWVRGWDAPATTPTPTPVPPPPPPPPPSSGNYGLWGLLGIIGLLGLLGWFRRNQASAPAAPPRPPAPRRHRDRRNRPERPDAGAPQVAATTARPAVTAPAAQPATRPNAPGATGALRNFRTEVAGQPGPDAPATVRPATPPAPPAPRRNNDESGLDLRDVLDSLPTERRQGGPANRQSKRDKKRGRRPAKKAGRRAHVVLALAILGGLLGLANTVSAQTVRLSPNMACLGADPNKAVEAVTVTATISGFQASSLEVPAGGITGTVSGNRAMIMVTPQAHEGPNNLYLTGPNGQKVAVKFFVFGHTGCSVAEFAANHAAAQTRTAVSASEARLRAELAKTKTEAVTMATTSATTAAKAEVPAIARQEVRDQIDAQMRAGGQLNQTIEDLAMRLELRSMQYTSDALAMASKQNQQGLLDLQSRFDGQIADLRQQLEEIRQAIQILAGKEVQLKTSWPRRVVGADKTGPLAPELLPKEEK